MLDIMKSLNLNKMMKEIEAKIFEALVELGLKPSKVLEKKNQECHLITHKKQITLNKQNPNKLSNYYLLSFPRSPLCRKNADEIGSSQTGTFYFNSGKEVFTVQIFDSPLYPLN
jgi:hypothetical protein